MLQHFSLALPEKLQYALVTASLDQSVVPQTINSLRGIVLVPVLKVILNIILTIFYVLEAIIKTILYLISFQWDKIGGVWEDMGNKTKDAWNGFLCYFI